MPTPRQLPPTLDSVFMVTHAREQGVSVRRLRGHDLGRPFHGVRALIPTDSDRKASDGNSSDRYERARAALFERVRHYAPRLRDGQFFSHSTAAQLWGAPVPPGELECLHISAFRPARAPRCVGATGHELGAGTVGVTMVGGVPAATPASTWAMLGRMPFTDLVAIGDYFVRVWREGYFRPNAGMPPLATREDLRYTLGVTRRTGARLLRAAIELIREDAWSPTESKVRCVLADAGLPEPVLNRDFFDDRGHHLGCLDLAYPEFKVGIEYNGKLHGEHYARDIDRIETLRNAGWIIILVTWPLLFERPEELVRRVRDSLRSRGCHAV